MPNDEFDEVEFAIETAEDAKKVTLTLSSSRPMTMEDLMLAMEFYMKELTRAIKQREDSSLN